MNVGNRAVVAFWKILPCATVRLTINHNITFNPPILVVCAIFQLTITAMEECTEELEYAVRLLQKAAAARQARVAAQTPEGAVSAGGDVQSSGTISEVGPLMVCGKIDQLLL